MKTRKLLAQLMAYLDGDARQRRRERDDLMTVLDKLKRREKKLKRQLDDERDAERRVVLQQEIDIIHAQRKKGVRLLKEE